jgi:hypothetical protein
MLDLVHLSLGGRDARTTGVATQQACVCRSRRLVGGMEPPPCRTLGTPTSGQHASDTVKGIRKVRRDRAVKSAPLGALCRWLNRVRSVATRWIQPAVCSAGVGVAVRLRRR